MALPVNKEFKFEDRFIVVIETDRGWEGEYWNGGGPMGTDTYEWSTVRGRLPAAMNFEEASRVAGRAREGHGRGYGPPPKGAIHMFELQFNDVTPIDLDDILRREALRKRTDEEIRVLGITAR